MDFVTRQFIVLAKKLRAEVRRTHATLHRDLVRLSDGFKNLKDTIAEQGDAANKRHDINRRVTIANPESQVPIRVETESKRSKIEHAWRYLKGALEVAVGAAIILYTGLAYENLQEQIDATNFAGIQAKKSREALNVTIKQFQIDQRPYISIAGINSVDPRNPTHFGPPIKGEPAMVTINYRNNGKTQAFQVATHIHMAFDIDQIKREPPDVGDSQLTLDPGPPGTIITGMSMDDPYKYPGSVYPPQNRIPWDGTSYIFTFGRFRYEDRFGNVYCYPCGKVRNVTEFCPKGEAY